MTPANGETLSSNARRFLASLQPLSRRPRAEVVKHLQKKLKVDLESKPRLDTMTASTRVLEKKIAVLRAEGCTRQGVGERMVCQSDSVLQADDETAKDGTSGATRPAADAQPVAEADVAEDNGQSSVLEEVADLVNKLQSELKAYKIKASNMEQEVRNAVSDTLCTLLYSGMDFNAVRGQMEEFAAVADGDIMASIQTCAEQLLSERQHRGESGESGELGESTPLQFLSALEEALKDSAYLKCDFGDLNRGTLLQVRIPAPPPP